MARVSALLLTAVVVLGVVPAAPAQDEVTYLDRSRKEAKVYGAIQSESPSRIVILSHQANAAEEIAAADVVDVHYHVSTLHRLELLSAINSEKAAEAEPQRDSRRKLLGVASRKYQELLSGLGEERAKRHVEFKIAKLMALEADVAPTSAGAAIDQLAGFTRAYPDSWQLAAAASLRAGLQLAQGDVPGAQKTYEDLASRNTVSKETAEGARVRVVQLEVRGKHYDQAEARARELMRDLKPDDLQSQRLQVVLAVCRAATGKPQAAIQSLQTLLASIRDPEAKAEAYNALGDCYRLTGQPAQARWPYLTVDVLYRQDRDEHARALYALAQVFRELKDDVRANQFRDQLENDARLFGTEYQRRLEREK